MEILHMQPGKLGAYGKAFSFLIYRTATARLPMHMKKNSGIIPLRQNYFLEIYAAFEGEVKCPL